MLQDMSNFEKTKALIDKYDPDAKPVLAMAPSPGQGAAYMWDVLTAPLARDCT